MDLFDIKITFKPVKLTRVVAKLPSVLDEFGEIPEEFDLDSVINSFLSDYNNLTDLEFYCKWSREKRYLRYFLFYLAENKTDLPPEDKRRNTRMRTILIRLLDKYSDQLRRFVPIIGMVAFNNLKDENLWDIFHKMLVAYNGRREVVINWKNIRAILKSPSEMAGEIISKNLSIVEFNEKNSFENTDLGRQFIKGCCIEVLRNQKESDKSYQKELFGDYFIKGDAAEDWGLLSKLDIKSLAPFINEYCSRFSLAGAMPSQANKVLHYLKQEPIMGNPLLGNKWNITNKHSREIIHRWIISKDFEIAFKRILVHSERHRYWVQWLNKIEMIRIFSPNSFALNTTLKNLDHKVEHLEYPTIFMKIGNAMIVECGERGKGGVYIYPFNNAVKWDKKLKSARDYKAPILDHPSRTSYGAYTNIKLPASWANISHHGGWETRVTQLLFSQFKLNYTRKR